MGYRLGIYPEGRRPDSLIQQGPGGEVVRAENIFPETPKLAREEWARVVAYYLSNAPEGALSPPDSGQVLLDREPFRLRLSSFRMEPPMTTLIEVGPKGRIFLGDSKSDISTLNVLGDSLQLIDSYAVGSAPSSLRISDGEYWVTLIGSVPPTDAPSGSFVRIDPDGGHDGTGSLRTLVEDLRRPVHASYGDLNRDGLKDVVISEFGWRTGELAWHEQRPGGHYVRHTLWSTPGAQTTVVRDFNGDGWPDIMALFGQGREGIYIYYNEGGERFREEAVLRFPPSYGSTQFVLADFNDDGRDDILYVNGDNADYAPIRKGYHGIRIFLRKERGEYEQAYFYHMDGAYEAIPADFDDDGDLDIAAIAFFADYENTLTKSYVYLKNQGNLDFRAKTFKESAVGRWIVADAGDVDGDDDRDLVLGSYVGVGEKGDFVPTKLRSWWRSKGPSMALLENTSIR